MVDASLRTFISTILVLVSAIGIALLDPVQVQGLKAMDWERRVLVPKRGVSKDVVLISVGQQDLDLMQAQGIGWPWPRELYGAIGRFATDSGAKSVSFDILFNHDTPCGGDTDRQFAELLKVTPNTYLAAATFSQGGKKPENEGFNFSGIPPEQSLKQGLSLPLSVLNESAQGFGIVSAAPDMDGTFRRMLPFHAIDDKAFPSLGFAPFLKDDAIVAWSDNSVDVAGRSIPLDSDGQFWLNYRGYHNNFKSYSASEIVQSFILQMQGEPPLVDAFSFKNKHVVVGYAAPGLYDLSPTPFTSYAPGMEIHATALDNWINDDWLTALSINWSIALAAILSFMVFLAFSLQQRIRTSLGLAIAIVLLGLYTQIQLLKFGYVLNFALVLLPIVTVVMWLTVVTLVRENRERLYRQLSLERVVSPKVAAWMMADEQRMQRFGEERNITVFFSDLEGFTNLSESLGCHSMVSLLNDYLDFMHQAVLREEGIINKFIGDAVMAFWGAPIEQKDQSLRAIRMAMASVDGLEKFRASAGGLNDIQLKMRVGIDHGVCVVGNIGAGERFEYTAIGNTVNQASRLEAINKFYGTHILVGEAAWLEADNAVYGRLVDYVSVKGRHDPVRLYEPLAAAGQQSQRQIWIKDTYESAWQLYSIQHWQEAEELFKDLIDKENDEPSKTMLQRIQQFRTSGLPPEDWQGIYRFDKK